MVTYYILSGWGVANVNGIYTNVGGGFYLWNNPFGYRLALTGLPTRWQIQTPLPSPITVLYECAAGPCSGGDPTTPLLTYIANNVAWLPVGTISVYYPPSSSSSSSVSSQSSSSMSSSSNSSFSSSSSSSSMEPFLNIQLALINQSHNTLLPFTLIIEQNPSADLGDKTEIGFTIEGSNSSIMSYQDLIDGGTIL